MGVTRGRCSPAQTWQAWNQLRWFHLTGPCTHAHWPEWEWTAAAISLRTNLELLTTPDLLLGRKLLAGLRTQNQMVLWAHICIMHHQAHLYPWSWGGGKGHPRDHTICEVRGPVESAHHDLNSSSPPPPLLTFTTWIHGDFKSQPLEGYLCLYSLLLKYVYFHFRDKFLDCGEGLSLTVSPGRTVTLTCVSSPGTVTNAHYLTLFQQKPDQVLKALIEDTNSKHSWTPTDFSGLFLGENLLWPSLVPSPGTRLSNTGSYYYSGAWCSEGPIWESKT